MTVEYQLEKAEIIAMWMEQRRSAPQWLLKVYYYGIVPALIVALALAAQSLTIAMIFTLLYCVSGWLIQHRYIQIYYQTLLSEENYPALIGKYKVTLRDNGIEFVFGGGMRLFYWNNFKDVVRSAKYIRFKASIVDRVYIPLRAFSDEKQIEDFVRLARSRITVVNGQA